MAKRPIKLNASNEDMDELSGEAGTPVVNTPVVNTPVNPPVVSAPPVNPPVVSAPPVTPKNKPALLNAEAERKEFFEKAKVFGTADGDGKRAFVQFARALVDAGMSGALSPSSKAGDARKAYEAFSTSSIKASGGIVEESNNNKSIDAQVSKAAAFIKLGHKYKAGGEAGIVFNRALDLHKSLMGSVATRESVKYRSAYTALYSIAVAQCRPAMAGQLLSEAAIRDLLVMEAVVAKEKDGWDVLMDSFNALERAMRGKAATAESNGRTPLTHPALPDIHEAMRQCLNDIDAERLKARDDELKAMAEKKAAAKIEADKKKAETAEKKAKADAEKAAQAQAAPVTPASDAAVETDEVEDETFDPEDIEGDDTDDTDVSEFSVPTFVDLI